ncbi:MAG: GerMN domain-containing protein [Chloroflexi bacterium]|nr:GerMN domain-containing protein [Chloroflexota bacterium]
MTRRWLVTYLVALSGLIGCSPAAVPTLYPTWPPSTVPASEIPTVDAASSGVSTPADAASGLVSPTAASAPTSPAMLAPGMMRVKLYFVAVGDGGKAGEKIGCGDSIVAVDQQIPATNAPLTATLNELFSLTDKDYGQSGLYNSLYQSKLKVDGISISGGKAAISLSGSLLLGGVCDNPRVQAQIEQTALQFSTVKSVSVTLNGVDLATVLSEKGG